MVNPDSRNPAEESIETSPAAPEMMTEEDPSRYRTLTGVPAWIARVISFSIPLLGLLYITRVLNLIKLPFMSYVYLPIFLGLTLSLVFLLLPFSKKCAKDKVPWYDWVIVAVALIATFYPAINYKDIFLAGTFGVNTVEMVLGICFLLVICEAVRRTTGIAMVVVVLFFLIHARFAHLFPQLLLGPRSSTGQVLRFVYLSNQGVFGFILAVGATTVLVFLLFGNFLSMHNGGKKFMDVSLALVGKSRGGIAKVAVVSSGFVGSISGSPTANVMITGSFTIPAMKASGYKSVYAGAVEAVASTGGLILPPVMGAVAFVAGDMTGLGYSAIAIAAIIPGILYFLSVFMQIHFRACREGLVGMKGSELPKLLPSLLNAWSLFVPFGLLIAMLLVIRYSAERSALIAIVAIVLVRFFAEKIPLREFARAFADTGKNIMEVIPVIAAAGIIVGSVSLTGLGINMSNLILSLSGGSLFLMIIYSAVASYILGMGVSGIASYIVLATLVAPAMVDAGIPLIAAHMFLIYVGAAMFYTPPYAPAAYAAGTLAGASPIAVGFQAMRLGIVAYLVPITICYVPSLLLIGSPVSVVLSIFTAIIGIIGVSAGLEGYLFTRLNPLQRIIIGLGGLSLFIPETITDIIGLSAFAVMGVLNFLEGRRARQALAAKVPIQAMEEIGERAE